MIALVAVLMGLGQAVVPIGCDDDSTDNDDDSENNDNDDDDDNDNNNNIDDDLFADCNDMSDADLCLPGFCGLFEKHLNLQNFCADGTLDEEECDERLACYVTFVKCYQEACPTGTTEVDGLDQDEIDACWFEFSDCITEAESN